jgi:glutamate carboxypeptidase
MVGQEELAERARRVRAHLNGQLEEMTRMLERFVVIESGSREKDAVDRIGEDYRAVMEGMGFEAEVIEEAECGNHLVFRKSGSGEGGVLVLAHLDTVWPSGTLAHWPFKVEGNRATGPGVADMKGGIVGAIFAARAIEELGLAHPDQLTFFFTGDEELGSPRGREHIEREARNHDCVLVVEPSDIDGRITTARGGIGAFHLKVKGVTAHAAAGPDAGASAIHALAAKIVELDRLRDWSRRVNVNVGLVEGGSARQVYAEHASAWIDLRVPNQQLADELMARVQVIVDLEHVPGTSATLEGIWTRPPSPQTDVNRNFFTQAATLAGAVGFTLEGKETGGGSDGSFTTVMGIPTLDGLGPNGAETVSTREYIHLDSMPERAALIAMILDSVARGMRPGTEGAPR